MLQKYLKLGQSKNIPVSRLFLKAFGVSLLDGLDVFKSFN